MYLLTSDIVEGMIAYKIQYFAFKQLITYPLKSVKTNVTRSGD